jgi:hypothetical protein
MFGQLAFGAGTFVLGVAECGLKAHELRAERFSGMCGLQVLIRIAPLLL